jgi:hypothetical protein
MVLLRPNRAACRAIPSVTRTPYLMHASPSAGSSGSSTARPGLAERVISPDPVAWYRPAAQQMGEENCAELIEDPLAIWKGWADNLRGSAIDSGAQMAEQNPEALVTALTEFLDDGAS